MIMLIRSGYLGGLEEMISGRSSDCEVYFTTITFKNMKRYCSHDRYEEFFKYFGQRLDNALLSNSKKKFRRPFFCFIPEGTDEALHFHGFIAIHKETKQRFLDKCVQSISDEYIEKLNQYRPSIHLKEKLTKPYPKQRYEDFLRVDMIKRKRYKERSIEEKALVRRMQKMLFIANVKMHPINSPDEIKRTLGYCLKRFYASDDNYDRIIIA